MQVAINDSLESVRQVTAQPQFFDDTQYVAGPAARFRFLEFVKLVFDQFVVTDRCDADRLVVARSNGDVDATVDGHWKDKAVIEVGVFADQVDAPRCHGHNDAISIAKLRRKSLCHRFNHCSVRDRHTATAA